MKKTIISVCYFSAFIPVFDPMYTYLPFAIITVASINTLCWPFQGDQLVCDGTVKRGRTGIGSQDWVV